MEKPCLHRSGSNKILRLEFLSVISGLKLGITNLNFEPVGIHLLNKGSDKSTMHQRCCLRELGAEAAEWTIALALLSRTEFSSPGFLATDRDVLVLWG